MFRFSIKALLAVMFWGMSFIATRHALAWLAPAALVSARLAIGAGVLAGGQWVLRKGRVGPSLFNKRIVLLGAILALHLLIQSLGLLRTTATNTGWIIGAIPLAIALGGYVFLGERISRRGWLGILLGAAGVGLVTLSTGIGFSEAKIGDLLQVSSCATWTAYTLLAVGPVARQGSIAVTTGSMAVAALLTLPTWFLLPYKVGPTTLSGAAAVLFLGVACSGLAFWLWFAAVRDIGSGPTGTYLYLEPFVTMIGASWLLQERITLLSILGGVTVLIAVAVVASASAPPGLPADPAERPPEA